MIKLFGLAADEIPLWWEDLEPLAQRFERECQTFTAQEIRTLAQSSKQQIFGIATETQVLGFVVTEIQNTARGLICVLVIACGTGPEGAKRELVERISQWAKELGCVALRIQGRKGWLRWDRGFKQTAIVAEKCLT